MITITDTRIDVYVTILYDDNRVIKVASRTPLMIQKRINYVFIVF